MLQGGDCAETFDEVSADAIRAKLKTAAADGGRADLRRLGAGREGRADRRPVRQAAHERRRAPRRRELPSYRGDMVNGLAFTRESGAPTRRAWSRPTTASAATLNLVRAFTQGGYADLRQVHAWNQDFVARAPRGRALRADGRRHRPRARLHDGVRRRPRGVPPGRPLRRPRGAGPRLRARADPHRLAHRAAVRRVRPLPVDRRAHPPARRRPRRAAAASATRSA